MKTTATILAAAMFVGDRTTASTLLACTAAVVIAHGLCTQNHVRVL